MSTGTGLSGDVIAHMYVHTYSGSIFDFSLKVLKEFDNGGTFVDETGQQGIKMALARNNVKQIRLVGERYLVFTVEEPEDLWMLRDFSAGAGQITLDANYGAKVTITPYGPGLKFDVTPSVNS